MWAVYRGLEMAVAMTGVMVVSVLAIVVVLSSVLVAEADGECSCSQPCPNSDHCCSRFGFCGEGDAYCDDGCQAGPCKGGAGTCDGGLGAILTQDLYEEFFSGHLEFYSYDVLIEAAKAFPEFGTTGDETTRKREIAAYAAHVTHETSGLFVRFFLLHMANSNSFMKNQFQIPVSASNIKIKNPNFCFRA